MSSRIDLAPPRRMPPPACTRHSADSRMLTMIEQHERERETQSCDAFAAFTHYDQFDIHFILFVLFESGEFIPLGNIVRILWIHACVWLLTIVYDSTRLRRDYSSEITCYTWICNIYVYYMDGTMLGTEECQLLCWKILFNEVRRFFTEWAWSFHWMNADMYTWDFCMCVMWKHGTNMYIIYMYTIYKWNACVRIRSWINKWSCWFSFDLWSAAITSRCDHIYIYIYMQCNAIFAHLYIWQLQLSANSRARLMVAKTDIHIWHYTIDYDAVWTNEHWTRFKVRINFINHSIIWKLPIRRMRLFPVEFAKSSSKLPL